MSDIIDINVGETIEEVTINVVDNLITVNINKVTGGGGTQTLAQTLDYGNTTGGENISISNGDAIVLDNGSMLKKGTIDAGNGGSKGISQICGVGFEHKWEAGRLYIMNDGGTIIREVSHNLTYTPTATDDVTKGFVQNTRWILDNGDLYVCTDPTEGAAVWELQATQVNSDWNATSGVEEILNKPTIPTNTSDLTNDGSDGVNPFITAADVPSPQSLNDVTVIGNISNQSIIIEETGVNNIEITTNSITRNAFEYGGYLNLTFPNTANPLSQAFQDASGYIALLSDIPAPGVTSVGLTMPSAFSVTNSPITSSGDIAVTGAGLVSQYVRGDGTLANFPTSTGGGSSVNYYLNGSVSQGTFGGDTYYEMSKTPILGAGTNFTRTNGQGNGYIASFITDAGDPSFLNIPAGNWNVEFYFQSSSTGGSPQFYGEIYKVSATNVFTLVASGSANPEGITNGTTVDQYFTSIPVPQTSLLINDRLAVRIYVITSGRTITLHTENGNLCEVLTTFTTGLTALNGLTQQVQNLAVGTSGTDFAISSATDTHTFNLPTASASNRGALSSTDWSTFNGKQNALGFTAESVANKSTNTSLGTSDTLYPTQNAVKVYADTKLTKPTWVDYSLTSTIVGFSSLTTRSIWVLETSTELIVIYNLDGTSNSVNTSFTIPSNSSLEIFTTLRIKNAGTTPTNFGLLYVGTNSNVVSFFIGNNGALWAATLGKSVTGQVIIKK